MNEKERDRLIQELFSVLEATGAKTISGIQEGGLKSLTAMIKQLDQTGTGIKGHGAGADRWIFRKLAGTPSAAGA